MKKMRIANLDQWAVPKGGVITWQGSGRRQVAIEVNPVGPVVAYYMQGEGKAQTKTLLAVLDEPTEVIFHGEDNFAVHLEGEAWVRRDQTPIFVEADPDLVSFTRFEKVGLYHDEIGMALHRQAILQRLSAADGAHETSQRAQRLEAQLGEVNDLVKTLVAERDARAAADKKAAEEAEAKAKNA